MCSVYIYSEFSMRYPTTRHDCQAMAMIQYSQMPFARSLRTGSMHAHLTSVFSGQQYCASVADYGCCDALLSAEKVD